MKVDRIEGSAALSQATRAGDWIFVSGQRAEDGEGRVIGAGDFRAQAEAALESVGRALGEAGAGVNDVAKLTGYLVTPTDMEAFHEVCNRTFCTKRPAGTAVAVSSLVNPDALVEIEACARLGGDDGKNAVRSNSRTRAFAEGVRCGDTVLISGQTAEGSTDFSTQLYGVYDSINGALSGFGAEQKDLVKINYFISNPLYYQELYRIREEVFAVDWPGDSVVSVRALDKPGALVECDAVALAPPAKAKFVNTPELPPPFNFSNVVAADGLAYVSGQVARDKGQKPDIAGGLRGAVQAGIEKRGDRSQFRRVFFRRRTEGVLFHKSCRLFRRVVEDKAGGFRAGGRRRSPALQSTAWVVSRRPLCEIDAIAAIS